MKCPKCGSENNDTAKFCKSCGEKLFSDENKIITHNKNGDDKNKKIIIGLIAVVLILIAGVALYASGVFGSNVELQTQEFDGFKLDVPVDSKFKLSDSYTTDSNNIFVGYLNDGKYSDSLVGFQVGTNLTEDLVDSFANLEETDGDLKIYKNDTDETFYEVYTEGKDANFVLLGTDLNTMKRMAQSFEDKDFKKLAQTSSEPTTPTANTQTQTQTKTATAMSILGGSFSTGGGLEDKTYAKINVGNEHAGESVIIQIFYSRDGADLNNGNMVPKTVTSDGYIEVASAEPYDKFPDHADINLYDSSSNLLDTYSVDLSPSSGTQTF